MQSQYGRAGRPVSDFRLDWHDVPICRNGLTLRRYYHTLVFYTSVLSVFSYGGKLDKTKLHMEKEATPSGMRLDGIASVDGRRHPLLS
jgi:hypothetical protein